MDPINILFAVNLLLTISANFGATKSGFKTSTGKVIKRPVSYLQNTPMNVLAAITLIELISIFEVGTLSYIEYKSFEWIRICGLAIFGIFSWGQVLAFKTLKEQYSQEILIHNKHRLVKSGLYRYIRHPQYLSQILSDFGAALVLLSYVLFPIVIFLEIPLLYMRAKLEEDVLSDFFKEKYSDYKKISGFFIPFIG